jgi:hypothetical protein
VTPPGRTDGTTPHGYAGLSWAEFFPQRERRLDLELVETRTFSSRVVYLRYRVAR